MLKKFVSDTGKDWDKWLPFLLFAYHEVPQSSTGFSPFELIYGHQVRGPLDVMHEMWEESDPPETMNIISFVLKMRKTLMKTTSMAHDNLLKSQVNRNNGMIVQPEKGAWQWVSRYCYFCQHQKTNCWQNGKALMRSSRRWVR